MAPLVLITGASSGIGQALALAYAQQGWRLALVARRADQAREAMLAHGVADAMFACYGADVCDVASMADMAAQCCQHQGLPDVVIANAGVSIGVDLSVPEDLTVMANVFNTNVLGVAATFAPFIAAMRARGRGQLVGVASVAGIRGLPGHAAYSASKAAVISLCESLRVELRSQGVQVQVVCPGYVATPLTQRNCYRMPFLMQPEDFARRALRAIAAGDSFRVIPWQMAWVARGMRLLPNSWFDALFARRGRKARAADMP
jgi:short-subunit dehydrogenase